jgi:hypothetical protein
VSKVVVAERDAAKHAAVLAAGADEVNTSPVYSHPDRLIYWLIN